MSKSEYDGKMRPLPGEHLRYTDGYRGDSTIAWILVSSKKPGGRSSEMFGTWCVHCLTSWGWTLEASRANKLHRAMKKLGCPRCKSAPKPAPKPEPPRRDVEAARARLRK